MASGKDKLLFLTDSLYCKHTFPGLTYLMLGVDFDLEMLRDNAVLGSVDLGRVKRTLRNHMSLQTALGFFRANDMSRVQGIWLLHLSDTNSNAERFREAVERETGRPTIIADRH